ncbi:MAG: tRNA pseudouridine38-40 synthase [Clostridiales bacterium]|nr:tRNA pseudouridine38-40 synthase [Clostridiales bacterium]
MERNIKLILQYDGTAYAGWQYQKNALTIQQVVEEAVERLTGQHSTVIAAGRTDRGVHALGQAANFKTDSNIPTDRWLYALNAVLPEDIRVVDAHDVPMSFHARFDAKGKLYRYIIWNAPYSSALLRNFSLHVARPLDADAMRRAAQYLVGTHDFSSFQASGSAMRDTVRSIWDISIQNEDKMISVSISGDGFLYNMVRIMVGTLIDVGIGKITACDAKLILEARDRKRAGRTASPHGLYLVEVYY